MIIFLTVRLSFLRKESNKGSFEAPMFVFDCAKSPLLSSELNVSSLMTVPQPETILSDFETIIAAQYCVLAFRSHSLAPAACHQVTNSRRSYEGGRRH